MLLEWGRELLFATLFTVLFYLVVGDLGGALVFGRGTLYMKWRADLTRDDPILRTSSGLERQRELVNHNLTFIYIS